MRSILLCLSFCFFTLSLLGQKSPVKFGDIPVDDMTMKQYDHDTSASAVVLADYGEAYIQITSITATMTFERHVRIKILDKEGMRWADALIPLYQSGSREEKISGLKASTYNLVNGKIVETKLSKDGVFREQFNRNTVHQKFTLPDVKEGSVIEYSYKVNSEFLTNFPNWQFQRTIPTRLSEYWAIIPEFFTFEKYMQGYVPVSSFEVKPMNVPGYRADGHHYISKNVPAFKEEPHMTSESDYVSKLQFALSHINFPGQPVQEIMGSWQKLNTLLLEDEDFYGVIKGSAFLKSIVQEVTNGVEDPMAKVTAIHNYVKGNIEWDGYKDFLAGNLKKVLEQKKGSSGDINLLLASMLQKAGFEVDMVLLSTRDHGFVRDQFPMIKQFNYTVCQVKVGDKIIFLDATEKHLPANVLPEKCLNGRGLVISKTRHGWVPLDTKTKAKTVISAVIELDDTGVIKSKLEVSREGYDANKMRKAYLAKGQETYVKEFVGSKEWKLQTTNFENIAEAALPAKEIYEMEVSDHASMAGDNIYLSPFLTAQMEMNPYKAESRVYPVDYGSMVEQIYFCRIKLPEGYTVEETPTSKVLTLPGNAARYIYNISAAQGDWITITSSFQINRNIFLQDEYPNLREFYNQVVAKQAEQIVLKKKI